MKEIKFTREDLYNLVWSTPLEILSQRYWLSYHNFKEVCLNRNVPTPKPSYWNNLKLGNEVAIESLPEFSGKNSDVTLQLWEEGDESRPEHQLSLNLLQERIAKDKVLSIFSKKLFNPHVLIINSKKLLEEGNHSIRDNGLMSSLRGGLDIKVSTKNVDRALRFMDTLIKILIDRGHKVDQRSDETYALLYGEEVKICLRERTQKTYNKNSIWTEYIPTGILCFKIDTHPSIEWVDRTDPIEDKMAAIVHKLEITGIRLKERSQFWKAEREASEAIERKKKEVLQKKEDELLEFKLLLAKSERWKKSIDLKEYIDNMERTAQLNNSMTENLKKWIIWARSKIEWYDPNIDAFDELLIDVNKDTLTFIAPPKRYGY